MSNDNTQLSLSGEKANEGLPVADDYNPEAIGTAQLEAGEPDAEFPQYGLETVPILLDDQDTGRRIVRRNGDYVADVSESYKLLPNERVIDAANQVAQELGAVPFHDFDSDEFDNDWYIKLDDHVFQDADRHRVHGLYAWNEPVDIGDGDPVQFGFSVHNSIDGSLSFDVGLFSFRHACANMVLMTVKGSGLNVESARKIIRSESHKHTSGLEVDVESLKNRVRGTLMLVDPELDGDMNGSIVETYKAWRDNFVTIDHVEQLIDRMPAKDLPQWIQNAADDIEARKEELADGDEDPDQYVLPDDQRAKLITARMPETETVWSTYNDLTESIWHDDRTADTSKQRKMKKLHRVFEPAAGVR